MCLLHEPGIYYCNACWSKYEGLSVEQSLVLGARRSRAGSFQHSEPVQQDSALQKSTKKECILQLCEKGEEKRHTPAASNGPSTLSPGKKMLVQSPPPAPPHSSDSPTISPTGVTTAQSPSTNLQVSTGKALSLNPSQVSNQPTKISSMLLY